MKIKLRDVILVAFALAVVLPLMAGCSAKGAYQGIVPLRNEIGQVGGTGFVFARTEDRYFVATAEHVVQETDIIMVDGIEGEVVARDAVNDLAIVEVEASHRDYRVFKLMSAFLEEHVRAVGYTWSNGWMENADFMVYHGRVTCLTFQRSVTTNSGVYPGLSGGPLLNDNGHVIGITSRVALAWGLPSETTSIFVPAARLQELWETYQHRR